MAEAMWWTKKMRIPTPPNASTTPMDTAREGMNSLSSPPRTVRKTMRQ